MAKLARNHRPRGGVRGVDRQTRAIARMEQSPYVAARAMGAVGYRPFELPSEVRIQADVAALLSGKPILTAFLP